MPCIYMHYFLLKKLHCVESLVLQVEERPSICLLVAGMRKEVQGLVGEGIHLVWESYKLDPYVQKLAESVFNFQEKVGVTTL